MKFSDLQTQEGFSNFVQKYHQLLHQEKGFPPLGNIKALNTLSPIFGYKNWNAMSASNVWTAGGKRQEANQVVLSFDYLQSNIKPEEAGQKASEFGSVLVCFSSVLKANEYLWAFVRFNLKKLISSGVTLREIREQIKTKNEKDFIGEPFQGFILDYIISFLDSNKEGCSTSKGLKSSKDLQAIDLADHLLILEKEAIEWDFIGMIYDLFGISIDFTENCMIDASFSPQ